MKAKRTNTNPNPNPHGFRYSKERWGAVIKPMLDDGATYHAIAKVLGVSHTTVTRYVWGQGWATSSTHRNCTRSQILKERGIAPEVMHYAIHVPKRSKAHE